MEINKLKINSCYNILSSKMFYTLDFDNEVTGEAIVRKLTTSGREK